MKSAKSVEEQITLFKERGIIINDEEKVKEILLDIGYYRLGFYTFPFETTFPDKTKRQHIYKKGTTFMDVLDLYYFDFYLRNILLKYITRIEVNFRTTVTYKASMEYKKTNIWFCDNNVMKPNFITYFENKIYTDNFVRNNLVLSEHKKNHKEDSFSPAWKLMECLTFGNLISIYKSFLDNGIRSKIASHYGINSIPTFENYIDAIRRVRNICAHGGVLYDMTLSEGIANGPAGKIDSENRNGLKSVINVISYFLKIISADSANEMHREIYELISELYTKNRKSYNVVKDCSRLDCNTFKSISNLYTH